MANVRPIHLKVTTDNTDAIDLVPRLAAVVVDKLTAAGVPEPRNVAASVTAGVMTDILRIRQATVEESALYRAVERVRELHRQEWGACAECTHESGVLWPCPTIQALDGEEPQP